MMCQFVVLCFLCSWKPKRSLKWGKKSSKTIQFLKNCYFLFCYLLLTFWQVDNLLVGFVFGYMFRRFFMSFSSKIHITSIMQNLSSASLLIRYWPSRFNHQYRIQRLAELTFWIILSSSDLHFTLFRNSRVIGRKTICHLLAATSYDMNILKLVPCYYKCHSVDGI